MKFSTEALALLTDEELLFHERELRESITRADAATLAAEDLIRQALQYALTDEQRRDARELTEKLAATSARVDEIRVSLESLRTELFRRGYTWREEIDG